MQSNQIFTALKVEPAQLRSSRYEQLINFVTLPFRLVIRPFKVLVGSMIVPVTHYSELQRRQALPADWNGQNGKAFKTELIDYSIPQNKKCFMIMAVNKKLELPQETANRKLVIAFPGNCMMPHDFFSHLSNINKELGNDFLALGYPKGANSSKELVDAGVSAVLRAMQAGYQPENITIAGHSLGGAVAACALREMKVHLQDNEKFAGFVSHRSFSSIGDFVGAAMTSTRRDSFLADNGAAARAEARSSWTGWIAKGLTSLFGWKLNAEAALRDPSLAVKQMKIYADDRDEVIRHGASVAAALQASNNVPTKIKITTQQGHNGAFANSMFKPSKTHSDWDPTKTHSAKYAHIVITAGVQANEGPVL